MPDRDLTMSGIMWVEGEGACSLQNSSQHFDVDCGGWSPLQRLSLAHRIESVTESNSVTTASGIRRDLL